MAGHGAVEREMKYVLNDTKITQKHTYVALLEYLSEIWNLAGAHGNLCPLIKFHLKKVLRNFNVNTERENSAHTTLE